MMDLLAIFLFIQRRMLLPPFAARTHRGLSLSSLSVRLLGVFSQGCSPGRPQLGLVHGVHLSQVLDFAFALAEFHNVPVGPVSRGPFRCQP